MQENDDIDEGQRWEKSCRVGLKNNWIADSSQTVMDQLGSNVSVNINQ